MITTAGMQLSDRPPAPLRVKGPSKITTAGRHLSDRPPASLRFEGPSKITSAGMQLSARAPASLRLLGQIKITQRHHTNTTPHASGTSRTLPARPGTPGTGRRLGNHSLVGRLHPVQQRRDQ